MVVVVAIVVVVVVAIVAVVAAMVVFVEAIVVVVCSVEDVVSGSAHKPYSFSLASLSSSTNRSEYLTSGG